MKSINVEFEENIVLNHLDELHMALVQDTHGVELDEVWIERSDGTIEEIQWHFWSQHDD